MTAAKLVTLTKVRLPTRRKDTLRRVRLIDILQRNIHRKLNFISAPAGYGKTSLLIDFATDIDGDADATVCWYSIAAEDVALVPFAQHLIVAFQQRFPGFGRELAQRLASTGVRVDAYSLAVELINEMIRHVDEFCLLMIDDYHLAGENEDIARLIEIVLENLPDQVRIFIAGRSDFGIPSTSLYVRDDLNVLGAEELRFRPNELQDLVGRNYHFKLSDEQAQTLTTRADGWIIAMLMALRSEQHGSIPAFESGGQHLYAFLAEDVVRRQPIEVQEFLTATAVVDEFDEALCAHLLESAAAGERIRQAEARNLFLARIESEDGPSFRYHQLFIEFLRAQVAEQDPARQRALHERAAQWYADRGQYERAVRHARAAGNDAAAIAWMDRAALDYFVSGRLDVLLGWGDQLAAAPELLGDAPHLVVGVAKALSDAGRIDESEAMLDVFESAMESPGLAELQVQALFTRSMNQRLQGEYAEAVEAIRRARGLIDEHDLYRQFQADRYEGYCIGRLNDVSRAIELLRKAADGFRTLGYPHDLAETLNDLGFMFISKGEMMGARECATAVLEIRRQDGNRTALAIALNNLAFSNTQIGRYTDAWSEYVEALKLAREGLRAPTTAVILNGQGDVLRHLQDIDAARRAYDAARDLGEGAANQDVISYACSGLSEVERVNGDYEAAIHWLREAYRAKGTSSLSPRYLAQLGAIYLDMGQTMLALDTFEKAMARWNGDRQKDPERVLATFQHARAMYAVNKKDAALKTLAQALTWAAALGFDQFLVVAAHEAMPFLEYAIRSDPENHQLQSILRRANELPTGIKAVLGPSPEASAASTIHLEVFALADTGVRIQDEIVPKQAWKSKYSRAIFYYVVETGTVSKEQLAAEFWPDAKPSSASKSVYVAIWRARKALGPAEIIVLDDEHYQLGASVDIWYDVAEFEASLRDANALGRTDAERSELLRRAIDLYQVDFLVGIESDWVIRRREQLRLKYVHALTDLGDWERSHRRRDAAMRLYQRAIEVEAFHEPAHAGIMNCYAEDGLPRQAITHFRELEADLHRELGTKPSPEIVALYEHIAADV